MEKWREIEGYNGFYEVSNKGRVRSWRNGAYGKRNKPKILKGRPNKQGYLSVSLYSNGNPKYYRICRLVGKYFVSNPKNKPQINHINGVVDCDKASNLEWVTARENTIHAYRSGLRGNGSGFDAPNSKLSVDDIKWIITYYNNNEYNQTELADMFDTSQSHISRIVNKETGHFEDGTVLNINEV